MKLGNRDRGPGTYMQRFKLPYRISTARMNQQRILLHLGLQLTGNKQRYKCL